ncbi:MAG: tRNA lysidine(34) synthetase TilS [Gammaproteobacteria bacterium]
MPPLDFRSIADSIPSEFGKLYIAYSGGVDSEALLHLCATQAHLRNHLVAVHVHHGLQAPADEWEIHCRKQAASYNVAFQCFRVDATADSGESPEAAAREARYRAFRDLLQPGDLLLLAQHREDQLETVLLQLFRGSGIQGLAAMPLATNFGLGLMIRPLLNTPKLDIERYAAHHRLSWVEDPSNLNADFDRNFLRIKIIPLLKDRWPSLDKTVARSARHCGEAAALLDERCNQIFFQLINPDDNSLSLQPLLNFRPAKRNWLLRKWFEHLGLKPPSTALLNNLNSQVIHAEQQASSEIIYQGHRFRRYRQHLYCLQLQQLQKPDNCSWPSPANVLALTNGHVLHKTVALGGIDPKLWDNSEVTVQARHGGEKIKLPNRTGHHSLKNLYQEAGVPPWERETRPLIYLNGRLAAVAGLWTDEWVCIGNQQTGYHVTWHSCQENR